VDVVVDLVGEDEIAGVRVFYLQLNRPLGEAKSICEMDELRLLAEDFGKRVVVDLERQLGILRLGIRWVFLVGEIADFDFLGQRRGRKPGCENEVQRED
ncbi:MAG: hypothetical protein WCG52_08920, partial [bacterium]